MRTTIRRCWVAAAAAAAAAGVGAHEAAAQTTKVVTPPGSTTRVRTTPGGDQVITVTLNNKPVEFAGAAAPMMDAGRVMVPLRGVFEQLGGELLWEPKAKVVTGARPSTKDQFRMRVGSREALVNGRARTLDAPPRVVNGTTYVPLRFVSEALGAAVRWDNEARAVVITGDADAAP